MVRTRLAPSPTGLLHIGSLEGALFNYAFAKKNNGKFILRLEDTDRERVVEEAIEDIYETLKSYGLYYDEGPDVGGEYGPYVQSERLDIYRTYAEELVEKGNAYYCFCSKERLDKVRKEQQQRGQQTRYDGHCRNLDPSIAKKRVNAGEKHVIRLKVPKGKKIIQENMFGKPFEFLSDNIDDAILLKSDGYPTYYLGVVIDDHLMRVTHVWKGLEWQSSDPKLLLLYDAFGWEPPKFGYLPLLLDPEGGKLSKRKGSVSARSFLEGGHVPEAVINYLMLMGWNPGDEREIFSLEEFIKEFSVEKINPTSGVFDRTKLLWMNGVYLRNMDITEYSRRFLDWLGGYGAKNAELFSYAANILKDNREHLQSVLELEKDRAKTFKQLLESIDFFYLDKISYDTDDKKYKKVMKNQNIKEVLNKYAQLFAAYDEDTKKWNHDIWEGDIRSLADEFGWKHGDLFMLIRFSITGRSISPELFETMKVLGKRVSYTRLEKFINSL